MSDQTLKQWLSYYIVMLWHLFTTVFHYKDRLMVFVIVLLLQIGILKKYLYSMYIVKGNFIAEPADKSCCKQEPIG